MLFRFEKYVPGKCSKNLQKTNSQAIFSTTSSTDFTNRHRQRVHALFPWFFSNDYQRIKKIIHSIPQLDWANQPSQPPGFLQIDVAYRGQDIQSDLESHLSDQGIKVKTMQLYNLLIFLYVTTIFGIPKFWFFTLVAVLVTAISVFFLVRALKKRKAKSQK